MADRRETIAEAIAAPIASLNSRQRMAVRLSGEKVPGILEKLFESVVPMHFCMLEYAMPLPLSAEMEVRLPVLLLTMPARRSYTLEPVAELHFPANERVTLAVMERLYQLGVRPAEPGEFTRRAFLNGRITLGQAGSVCALISAADGEQRARALKMMAGETGDTLENLKVAIFDLRKKLESVIDFPEEPDVLGQALEWERHIQAIQNAVGKVGGYPGMRRHARLRLLLLGPANSGKSSLVKALVPGSIPVVSHIPGTTLDLVPYAMETGGESLVLYDSPGLKEAEHHLDRISLERLHRRIREFDAYVIFAGPADAAILELNLPEDRPRLHVVSKCDLPGAVVPVGVMRISSATGEGLSDLKARLVRWSREHKGGQEPWQALERRLAEITIAKLPVLRGHLLENEHEEELAAFLLDELLDELHLVTHVERSGEELLDGIFRDFCIGK